MRELSDHVMDIVQNSVSAGATRILISISEDSAADRLTVAVEDNGGGMTAAQAARVTDPFYTTRTTRTVGLGIPLFQMAAEMTGGRFRVTSEPGAGTKVTAEFVFSHVDMVPLGDIDSTVRLLIACNPGLDFVFCHRKNQKEFTLDTRELRKALGGEVPLSDPEVQSWIRESLAEQTQL